MMAKSFLIAALLLIFCYCRAQTKEKPLLKYFNYANQQSLKEEAAYQHTIWKEGSLWNLHIQYIPTQVILATSSYNDKELTVKHGNFSTYFDNGKKSGEGSFSNGKKNGLHQVWTEKGVLVKKEKYLNGIAVDTSRTFDNSGKLISELIADKNGIGTLHGYYETGNIKMSIPVKSGKRDGVGNFYNESKVLIGKMTFAGDSVTSRECVTPDGQGISGNCNFRVSPEFKGGDEAWHKYVNKVLWYPEEAEKRKIKGMVVVRFTVDENGYLSNFDVLSSPDKILSDEAIRFIKKAPAWLPAEYFGQKVSASKIVHINFKLPEYPAYFFIPDSWWWNWRYNW